MTISINNGIKALRLGNSVKDRRPLGHFDRAFIGLALLSTAGGVYAQEAPAGLTAVSAVDLCAGVFKQPSDARSMLQSKGWKVKVSKSKRNAVYNESEAGFFEKDDSTVIFILENTSFGRDNAGYRGSCQVIFPGNSPIAATEIAAHFQKPADAYQLKMRDVSHSFTFNNLGYLVNLANITGKTDPSKNTGAMRILVAPQ